MRELDDLRLLQELDPSDMRQIVLDMPGQLRDSVRMQRDRRPQDAAIKARFSKGPIIIAGMGGSAIGGDIVASLASEHLDRPIVIWRDYGLPKFAASECLLLLSSYSGDTAEMLSALEVGLERGCQMVVVTSGGKALALARELGLPIYLLPGGFPPRGALAYSTVALWTALSDLELLPPIHDDAMETAELLDRLRPVYSPECPETDNPAKRIAAQLHGCIPVLYGSCSATAVAALRWRGQLAENAKMLSSHNLIPEMNHNEIMGYQLPLDVLKSCHVVFLRDSSEDPRVARRMEATSELLKGRTKGLTHLHSSGNSRMARLFSLIYLGDCVSLYASILNRVDPFPVEMINALKSKLQS